MRASIKCLAIAAAIIVASIQLDAEASVSRALPAAALEADLTSVRKPDAPIGHARRPEARIRLGAPVLAPLAHTRFCLKYPAECRVRTIRFRGGAIALTPERRAELVRANTEVNRAIRPQRSSERVIDERWLIAPLSGDCNDYAVTKRHQLLAKGWPARALLLAEVVVPSGEHHLVLVARTREGDYVADNLTKTIHHWSVSGYQWLRMQSPANPMFWSTVGAPEPETAPMTWRRNQVINATRMSSEAAPNSVGR
jgi:predicted transglutaminase-like cysteine proteinase